MKHVWCALQNIPSPHIAKRQTKITSFAVLMTTLYLLFSSYIYLFRRGFTNILGCIVDEIITKSNFFLAVAVVKRFVFHNKYG